jgi:glycosyltransferase involved in cell wall biosynthesis
VLYVGVGCWFYFLPRLLRAVEKAKLPFVMVGKVFTQESIDYTNPWNSDLETVKKIADNNKSIFRLGFVPLDDLVNLYNLATVFVMPSLYEGFGLPILEAMQCGCPVVTSKEGSIPEIAQDAVQYVDAYDEESIKEGVLKIFNDEKLQEELSNKGLDQVKKFDWEKTARETIKSYEKS